jgi:hypothetical protein
MDADRIIAEVARIHGVRLGRDDAILIAATINRLTLDEALAAIRQAVQESQDQIAAGTAQQIEQAKRTAAKLITDAAVYSAERLRAAGEEAAQRVLEAAAGEVAKAETARRHAVQAAYAAGGLFLVGLAVAGLLVAGL